MTEFKLVPADHKFEVPKEVAVCPYCNTKLRASVQEWTEDSDGWVASSIEMICEKEPDIDDPLWEEFTSEHSEMPYVYLLPVQSKVEDWINSNFRFDMER